MTAVDLRVQAEIERRGPIPFAEVVEAALYGDGGFYASGGGAGRHRDFLTSPEVGPLFGAVVARAIDGWWDDAGQPPTFVVVEAGAGPGTLARAVLAAGPRCAAALRYVLVERSEALRAQHARHLPLEPAGVAFATVADPDDDSARVPPPLGPIVVSLAELPRLPGPCTVIANELLDNLPFGLAVRTPGGWSEVHVGLAGKALVEVLLPADVGLASTGREGARLPLQPAAAAWVGSARALAGSDGRVVAFDYASTTAELLERPWTEWVRTYKDHARGGPPLELLGTQDITCEVAVDQLPGPVESASQAAWLRRHGIEALVEDGRAEWEARASIGDLAAVRARSRVTEGQALLDEDGLGGFRVLEWRGT